MRYYFDGFSILLSFTCIIITGIIITGLVPSNQTKPNRQLNQVELGPTVTFYLLPNINLPLATWLLTINYLLFEDSS